MVYYNKTFDTKEDAEAWRQQVYAAYHPLGYGTHLREPEQDPETGKWRVIGSRGDTCD